MINLGVCVLVHSPPAGSPERPTVMVSPLRSQSSSPSRCSGQSGRPLSMVSPGPSLGPSPLSSPAPRPLPPLSSPLSCLTPPNVSAALLNSEPASPVQPPLPGPSHASSQGVLAPKVEKVTCHLLLIKAILIPMSINYVQVQRHKTMQINTKQVFELPTFAIK